MNDQEIAALHAKVERLTGKPYDELTDDDFLGVIRHAAAELVGRGVDLTEVHDEMGQQGVDPEELWTNT
jgi:hypothetical protein